jgi:hypothetical protein
MVRRLKKFLRDAGTGGAACRVKTCGTAGGREVKEHDRGHTVGEQKLRSVRSDKLSSGASAKNLADAKTAKALLF